MDNATEKAGGGTRTHDLVITSDLLYQLSYSGVAHRVRGGAATPARLPTSRANGIIRMVSLQERTAAERITAERGRYVASAVTTPRLVVAQAEGAYVTDVDGRSYIDFAGGIACQNTGHRHPAVVEAVKEQADRYLHQCFIVGTYEPYVEVCRRLAELSPCGEDEQRSILVNSGAEASGNAVKLARAATGRPAVVVFENAFHGRTLLTMSMTAKVVPYKKGFGPFAPEVYRAPGPYPYRAVSSDAAIEGLEDLFRSDADPESVACVVLEPVQGEGGFIPMPPDFPARVQELCRAHAILYVDDEVQSGVGRTGEMWAIEHYDGVEPDLVVSGKSLGGGLPLAGVTGRAEIMDAVPTGGLGGTFSGNPLSCAAAVAVLDVVSEPAFLAEARALGETMRARLDEIATRHPDIGEVRGLGPMLAFEFDEQSPDRAKAVISAAFDRGLLVLTCGIHGNVLRLLPPLTVSAEELDEGLAILEEALAAGD
jgi:4-aminobutyrate aminotransferase / (S)-3-amino-2-methylpropionate transaminase / 5-aminovalerate transaminase